MSNLRLIRKNLYGDAEEFVKPDSFTSKIVLKTIQGEKCKSMNIVSLEQPPLKKTFNIKVKSKKSIYNAPWDTFINEKELEKYSENYKEAHPLFKDKNVAIFANSLRRGEKHMSPL